VTCRWDIKRTVSLCFSTLRQLRSIRRQVLTAVFQSLVVALVLSRLYCCNGMLIGLGLPANFIWRLQLTKNAAARPIFGICRSEHITAVFPSASSLKLPHSPGPIKFRAAVRLRVCRSTSPASPTFHLDRDCDHPTQSN